MPGDFRLQGSVAMRDLEASRGTGRNADGGGDKKLAEDGVTEKWLVGVGGFGSGVADTGRRLMGVCGGAR